MDNIATRSIHGYITTAEITNDGTWVEFKVYSETDGDRHLELEGHIKWDGCSNFTTLGYMHFCSQEGAKNVGLLLGELYEWADELLPGQEVL